MKKYLLFIYFVFVKILISSSYLLLEEINFNKSAEFYTVIKNQNVEKFNIELLSILKENTLGNMIFFKILDPRIILAGGIGEGMSGSPVYQDGKFIGAIAYGLKENSNYGLIMPSNYFDFQKINFTPNIYTGRSIIVTPVDGDVSFDMLGTLTVSDKENIYVLGHNIENKGEITYFLKNASVDAIIPTNTLSFKLGTKLDNLGVIFSDNKYGLIGKQTSNVEVHSYNFYYKENGIIKKSYFKIPKNKKTKELYLEKSIVNILENLTLHNGYKSAKYKFSIYDKNNKILFSDRDFIVSNDNIKISLANTIFNKIMHVTENKYQSLPFEKIDFDIELFENESIIYIDSIDILGNVFILGDKLKITFDSYIHQVGHKKIIEEIEIPKNFALGSMTLEVLMEASENEKKVENLTDFLVETSDKKKNNEIIVRFKDKFNTIIYSKKIVWDYYIISEENFTKNIVIDSFEASN